MFGSLLVFFGIISLSWNYLLIMKGEVYSDMLISMMDDYGNDIGPQVVQTTAGVDIADPVMDSPVEEETPKEYVIDYSKYLGVLEIPKIGLKRGFYNFDSRYNNIAYNVTLVEGSKMPDVENGNLILMAHSGTSYISYFAYLYKLDIGDDVYVTYFGRRYHYQIVNIYDVEKNGVVRISRDYNKTCLTMITCTKDNDYSQTVYISELIG